MQPGPELCLTGKIANAFERRKHRLLNRVASLLFLGENRRATASMRVSVFSYDHLEALRSAIT
jgi:hypothetical protein